MAQHRYFREYAMKKTIRTLPELQALRSFKARHGIRDVSIELPGSFDEIRKLETQINKSLKACGCEIGAIFVATGILTLVSLSLLAPNYLDWPSPKTLFGVVGFLVALALTGKIVGLSIANRRLQLTIRELEHAARLATGE